MVFKTFVDNHRELFTFQTAAVVHPHDHFLHRLILRWLPRTITPNWVTFGRVVLVPITFFLIHAENYVFGIPLFMFAAFTDAIDGSLARTRGQITPFGILFDPLADKLLIGSMVLLLVFRYFSWWLGVAILGLEIVIMASALVAKWKFETVRMANRWGKIKMVLQVIAVFLTLLALLLNFPYLLTAAAWLFGLAIGFAVVSLFAHGV